MTCHIHRQVTAERLSQIQPDDPGPEAKEGLVFTQHDHDKAGMHNSIGVLFLGAVALAAIYLGVDWTLHASGILPHK